MKVVFGHDFGLAVLQEVWVFIPESEKAAGLAADYRSTFGGSFKQTVDIVTGVASGAF